MKNNNLSNMITSFFTVYLVNQKGVSNNTIKSYKDTFKILLIYLKNKKQFNITKITIEMFSKDIIIDFLDYLEKEKKNTINTRNQRLAVLRTFFKYLQIENPIYIKNYNEILSIPMKKREIKSIDYLDIDSVKILLQQPNLNSKNGIRDMAILSLLYDTAARVSELINICIEDLRLDNNNTVLLHGKGNKNRLVPITNNTKKILLEYIKLIPNNKYLFENHSHNTFSRKGICYIIDKYAKEAHKKSVTIPEHINPHSFRHSRAMHLVQSGVNLIYIRDYLGHIDIETTEIYAKYDPEIKRKAIENAYPDINDNDIPNWHNDNKLLEFLNSL